MRLPILIFGLCTLIIVTTAAAEEQSTSFWDLIPGISQGKSIIQLIFGDKEGAVKTQEHFLNEGLGSSQLRSGYFLIIGEPTKALEIQKKFASDLEVVIDGVPVVGHVKGGIHLLTGDHDHGWQAIKAATSTTGAVVGAMVGGPAGAVGGHILTDALITVTDVALNGNQSQPYGLIEYVFNINKLKPGEHFDAIAGLILDAKAGSKVINRDWLNIHQVDHEAPAESFELQPMLENKEDDNQRKIGMPNKSGTTAEETEPKPNEPGQSKITSYSSQQKEHDESNASKFKAFKDFLQHDPTYKYFGLYKVWTKEVKMDILIEINFEGLENFQHDNYLDNLDVDSLKNKLSYLTDDEKSLINKNDFRTVNTKFLKKNCLSCSFASILKTNLETVERYIEENIESDDLDDRFDTDFCLEALKRGKLVEYTVSPQLDGLNELNTYLKSNAQELENKQIMLDKMLNKEEYNPPNIIEGHSVILKFKMVKDNPEPVKLLIDYQQPGFVQLDVPNPHRFQPFIDTNTYKYFYVNAIKVLNQ